MAPTGLLMRLNSPGYKNWIKAGLCLQQLKSSLQEFLASEMMRFHRQLASRVPAIPGHRCQCRPTGKQFHPSCPVCAEWKKLILDHHTNRKGEIHWGNCNPSLWPTHYWEVAKVYMPRGYSEKKSPQVCDATALLNLINACDHFKGFNITKVREVIKCRNDLMHSSDMELSSSWLKDFGTTINNFISEFRHVPGLKEEGSKIKQVLHSDWTTESFCRYEVDGPVLMGDNEVLAEEFSLTLIYNTEKQLIQQLLEERYLQLEEDEALSEDDLDGVHKLKTVITDHEDLQEDMDRLELLLRKPNQQEASSLP
ncbi:uncharacterized protein CXorf38 homolog [Bombina bombina]|uniref:uncharacterized protein CXorf38 homolog n=1 Tax=Bombina bombina TaxID=8345 RepID=UPI00235A82F1|nr:uncharacterized protein CXorf38 homolog [Bombina bombina]